MGRKGRKKLKKIYISWTVIHIFPALRANKIKDQIKKHYEQTGSIEGRLED